MRERITVAGPGDKGLLPVLAPLSGVRVAPPHHDPSPLHPPPRPPPFPHQPYASSLLPPASVTILSAQFLPLILAAAGQTTVMLLGGIDLSLGAVLGLPLG